MITKFSRLGGLPNFLTHGAPLARFARWSSANIQLLFACCTIFSCTARAMFQRPAGPSKTTFSLFSHGFVHVCSVVFTWFCPCFQCTDSSGYSHFPYRDNDMIFRILDLLSNSHAAVVNGRAFEFEPTRIVSIVYQRALYRQLSSR